MTPTEFALAVSAILPEFAVRPVRDAEGAAVEVLISAPTSPVTVFAMRVTATPRELWGRSISAVAARAVLRSLRAFRQEIEALL